MTAPLSLAASLRLLLCEEPDMVALYDPAAISHDGKRGCIPALPEVLVLDAVGRIPPARLCPDCVWMTNVHCGGAEPRLMRACPVHRPIEGAGGRKTARAPALPSTAAVGRAVQAVRRTARQQRRAIDLAIRRNAADAHAAETDTVVALFPADEDVAVALAARPVIGQGQL